MDGSSTSVFPINVTTTTAALLTVITAIVEAMQIYGWSFGDVAVKKDAADTRFHRVDRVQQYSEKRTRITATPDAYCRTENDRQFRCPAGASPSHLPTLTSGTAPFSKSSTCNSFSEVDDFSDLDANSQTFYFVCFSHSPPAPCKTPYQLLASGVCFNSVKRRQLERLQKRSDWFLSPPTGLRNSGMIRLDASSPDTPRNAHKMSRSSLGDNGNENASRSRPTSTTGENLRRKPSHRNMQLTACVTEEAQIQQPDAFVAPNAFTSGQPAGLETSSNGHTSANGPLSVPAPTSWTGAVNGVSGGEKEEANDDNDDVLEVRYFIAEKYYGPGPRPPFRKNANRLFDSRPEDSCVVRQS
ncbi:unnamed protein product [Schistocephalus solidus]|uniref:Uncharacterized protein n=1 Tax=Schistocephalus solidus TaxID=70667 RepID=A0A183TJV7_SCHSO|nr:unnamed protein product [Schistocephalus solidus]